MANRTFGILTSGGDCPGLNAAIRAVAKTAMGKYGMDIVAINNGYKGLVEGNMTQLDPATVSGILTEGGTILGTSREKPFKKRDKLIEEEGIDKIEEMKINCEKYNLECIVVLGGNGSQKTSSRLQKEGINVVGLPKTIDNDLYGTDVTIGFHTALDIATEAVDRLHSTAYSHNRVMILEVMGHKAGWLALFSGIAGGGDVIIIPEIPYEIDSITSHLVERANGGKAFSILVVAEGALSVEESKLGSKELKKKRKMEKSSTVGYNISEAISSHIKMDVRVSVLGYQQRGGAPSAYDRIIATRLGAAAAELVYTKNYGKMVAMENNLVTAVPLEEIAGKLKLVPCEHQLITDARNLGTCFGD